MSLTRIADVLDALYDIVVADPTISGEVGAERLRTFDGPPDTDWSAETMLVIGLGPKQDDEGTVEAAWTWSSMGVSGQFADVDETIRVPCGIATMRGDKDMRAARRQALLVYAAAAGAIRNSTLGIDVVMWCTTEVASLGQYQTADGAEVLVNFTAFIRTRI